MPRLVLVRHGQSAWNLENRFTGWWDVDLTEQGVAEAIAAGELLAQSGILPTRAFTSLQLRAIKTLHLALEACGRLWIPETKDWRLNERHYGGLTGLNKQETRDKHGAEQVHVWRRSFDVPQTESLKLTIERVRPYWQSEILPVLASGETVIISAHGNSLRALVKHLSNISDEEITGLEIPTGEPIVYDFDDTMTPGERHYLKDR